VKLTSLHIDRFGARSNLRLDGLSDQLNVVYGPNGSGKSTIINFLRWMLYGVLDDASRRYLTGSESRLGGSLRLLDGHLRSCRVQRYYDALHGDQVRISCDESAGSETSDRYRLTGVDLKEFDHVFSISFNQPPALDRLIDVTRARDFSLAYDPAQMQQIRDLASRLDDLKRSFHAWPADDTLATLQQRRQRLQAEAQAAERRYHERLRQLQQECDALSAEIDTDRRHLESLQAMLRRTEATIQSRRSQVEQTARQAVSTRQRWLDIRRQEVDAIEHQVQQWQSVLEAVRQRQDNLSAQLASCQPQPALSTPADEAELRLFLRSLGHQIEDIEQDFRDWQATDEPPGHPGQGQYLHGILGAALHAMHDDVQRLCRELQRQQTSAYYHDHARELDHLRRCQSELNWLIELLTQRRQVLLAAPEYCDVAWTDAVAEFPQVNGTSVIRPWYEDPSTSQNGGHSHGHLGNMHGDSLSASHQVQTDSLLQARLAHLIGRRDHLAARMGELQTRIDQSHRRLCQIQASQQQLDEVRQLETVRREMDELDQRIRQAEERQRRLDEMDALQRQIDQRRQQLGPSEILRDAASMLQQLTDGAYRSIRVSEGHVVGVEDSRGHTLEYGELSRGTRDQVYLSMALAMVSAYRQRGVELPIVLDDVFANIDAERAQSTADLLVRFAGRNHQVILFTRHEHVMQRFVALRAKLYTLRERHPMDEPAARLPAAPAPDLPARSDYYLDQAPIRPVTGTMDPSPMYHAPDTNWRERPYSWVAQWDPPRRPTPVRVEQDTTMDGAQYPLREDSPLSEVDWLNRDIVGRLYDLGVRSVLQFLHWDPNEGQRRLADLSISAPTLDRWQSELCLQCYVGLSARDAALLVACGVHDPDDLASIDVSQLHRRIEEYLATSEARHRYGSIARFERPRLMRWIQAASRSRHRQPRRSATGALRSAHPSEAIIYRGATPERLTPRARRVEQPRVEPPAVTRSADVAAVQMPDQDDRAETLRFFLEPSDPIVDAPSIGPKTAERFHAIGVTTVAEMLELDPDDAATRINYRRITGPLIRSWQQQTALVCRVPNLRGHDAQLLIACDVPGPEQLAKLEPQTLLAQVTELLSTPDGKRILRNAKAPDLKEVAAWIRWAQHARQLQLA
jgi:energy-coupling factor transporter ATP-binding protein EcfA2